MKDFWASSTGFHGHPFTGSRIFFCI